MTPSVTAFTVTNVNMRVLAGKIETEYSYIRCDFVASAKGISDLPNLLTSIRLPFVRSNLGVQVDKMLMESCTPVV